jgi:hypothetical protein
MNEFFFIEFAVNHLRVIINQCNYDKESWMECHQSKITKLFTGIVFAGVILMSLSSVPAFAVEVSQAVDAPEVELYQDDAGQWKVKYVETNASLATSEAQQPAVAAASGSSDNLEVELYQDSSGEWKVKYVDANAASADAVKTDAVKTAKESKAADVKVTSLAADKKTETLSVKTTSKETAGEKVVEEVKAVKSVQTAEKKTEIINTSASQVVPAVKSEVSVKENNMRSTPVTMDESELKPVRKAEVKPVVATNPKVTSRPAEPVQKNVDVYEVPPEKSYRNPNNRFEFGMNTIQYKFNQDTRINTIGIPYGKTNEGMIYGLHAGYEYIPKNNPPKQTLKDVFFHIDEVNRYLFTLDYKTGPTTYSDINNVPKQDFTQHMLEGRAVAGYDFKATENTRVTPFFGVGYSYQHDPSGSILDILNGQTITSMDGSEVFLQLDPFYDLRQPYEIDTHKIYLPIGLMTNTDVTESISIGLNLEMDVLIWGMVKSNFSTLGDLYVEDLSSAPPSTKARTLKFSDTTNNLRGGFGFKGSTRITKKQKKFDWYIEPYIHYWHINESAKKQFPLIVSDGTHIILFEHDGVTPVNWVEAESSTTEYGLQIGVSY